MKIAKPWRLLKIAKRYWNTRRASLTAKNPNIHVIPTKIRIPNALLIFKSPSLVRSGSAAFGGLVASLYMISKKVMVLMKITNTTGVMKAAKNATSPIRQLKKQTNETLH